MVTPKTWMVAWEQEEEDGCLGSVCLLALDDVGTSWKSLQLHGQRAASRVAGRAYLSKADCVLR